MTSRRKVERVKWKGWEIVNWWETVWPFPGFEFLDLLLLLLLLLLMLLPFMGSGHAHGSHTCKCHMTAGCLAQEGSPFLRGLHTQHSLFTWPLLCMHYP